MFANLLRRFRDADIERRIRACRDECDEMTKIIDFARARREAAFRDMAALIKKRSPEQVARLERQRGQA